jgi:hypothetical protein
MLVAAVKVVRLQPNSSVIGFINTAMTGYTSALSVKWASAKTPTMIQP